MNTQSRTITINTDPIRKQYYQDLVHEYGSPLLAYEPSVLKSQFALLQKALPEVELFYAVKAHPDSHIIKTLDELGCGFDVASAGEMDLLLSHQISGRRTIHTHPIKKDKEIRDALRFGATTFVVDNLHELKKLIPAEWDNAQKTYGELTKAERTARSQYRRSVDNATKPVQEAIAEFEGTQAFIDAKASMDKLVADLSGADNDAAIDLIKAQEQALKAIEGTSDVRKLLAKGRRAMKGKKADYQNIRLS